jgi:ornithine carbamoyltransferase
MPKRDLLDLASLSPDEIECLMQRARAYKAGLQNPALSGRAIGMLFEKPSTRTRVSFEVAIHRLGGYPVHLPAEAMQIGRGETVADTARVLSGYLDALVIRTFGQERVAEWARHATVPIINGLTDLHHPCQILADLFTIHERRGSLAGLTLAYIGDGNNIAHSLMEGGALMGMRVIVAAPRGLLPDPQITARAMQLAKANGGCVIVHSDPQAAAKGADVLYTDVWVSMGQADDHARVSALQSYQINAELIARAAPNVLVMHCLPAHRGEEITEAAMEGPQSVILEQAANRLPVQQAILERWVAGGEG